MLLHKVKAIVLKLLRPVHWRDLHRRWARRYGVPPGAVSYTLDKYQLVNDQAFVNQIFVDLCESWGNGWAKKGALPGGRRFFHFGAPGTQGFLLETNPAGWICTPALHTEQGFVRSSQAEDVVTVYRSIDEEARVSSRRLNLDRVAPSVYAQRWQVTLDAQLAA